MTDIQIAYFAGLFDGEGCVMVIRSVGSGGVKGHRIVITVSNTNAAPIDALANAWGGWVLNHKARNPKHSDYKEWSLRGRAAVPFLTAIRPHCLIKGPQIDLALRAIATVKRGRGRAVPMAIFEERERILLALRALKGKASAARS